MQVICSPQMRVKVGSPTEKSDLARKRQGDQALPSVHYPLSYHHHHHHSAPFLPWNFEPSQFLSLDSDHLQPLPLPRSISALFFHTVGGSTDHKNHSQLPVRAAAIHPRRILISNQYPFQVPDIYTPNNFPKEQSWKRSVAEGELLKSLLGPHGSHTNNLMLHIADACEGGIRTGTCWSAALVWDAGSSCQVTNQAGGLLHDGKVQDGERRRSSLHFGFPHSPHYQ